MLQRLAENFQYADLLNKASLESDPYMKLAYISAFNISAHALNPKRTLKFFNPLLYETFELIDTDLKFKFFAEQVSHHPAVSACHAEGENYIFYTNSSTKQNFSITAGSLEITNLGKSYVKINSTAEEISYNRAKVVVSGLISGNMYVDFTGKCTVTNHTTGDYSETTFYPINNPKKGDQGVVKGVIKNYLDEEQLTFEGSWMSHIDVILNTGEKKRIWQKYETDTYENYYFTDFSSNLNNITKELKEDLPHTDSRLRPDQRALENHNLELAASEKHRLEEKQRARRKENEKKNKNYKHIPVYFRETYDDMSGDLIYEYNGKYWEDRKNKSFDHLIDIY